MNLPQISEQLDLTLERVVELSPELIWKAWTTPELIKKWFCPRPWKTVECDIDLRRGGMFRTVMQSPEGQNMPEGMGCYLEVVPNRYLVWTSAVLPDYRPRNPQKSENVSFVFTVHLILDPVGSGTRYRAIVQHSDEVGKQTHEKMGFHQGWNAALDQLIELMK